MKEAAIIIILLLPLVMWRCYSQRTPSDSNSPKENNSTVKGIDYCEDWLNAIVKPIWKEDVKGQFVWDDTIRCFTGSKPYWEKAIISNQFCLKGKSKEHIESILGIPTEEWKFKNGNTGVKYSICSKGKYGPEWHLQINYDQNLQLMNITESVTFIDID